MMSDETPREVASSKAASSTETPSQVVSKTLSSTAVYTVSSFEHTFVSDDVPDDCVCCICAKVLREPHLTECCGQHYCAECLNSWEKMSFSGILSCPFCRKEDFVHIKDKKLERKIREFDVYCPHKEEGCEWKGPLENLSSHFGTGRSRGCEYAAVECPNGCGVVVKRKRLEEHTNLACLLQKCAFSGAGCKVFVTKEDQSVHMMDAQQDHLVKVFQHVTSELQALRSKVETLQADNESLRSRLDSTEERLKVVQEKEEMVAVVLARELPFLQPQPTNDAALVAIECIQSRLNNRLLHLSPSRDPLSFRMVPYSEYESMGKPWYSPAFYISQGYKMCLAVHVDGFGAGKQTHISIGLHQLAGEYDSQLKWPFRFEQVICVTLLQQASEQAESAKKGYFRSRLKASASGGSPKLSHVEKEGLASLPSLTASGSPVLDFKMSTFALLGESQRLSVSPLQAPVEDPTVLIGPVCGKVELFCAHTVAEGLVYRDSLVFKCQVEGSAEIIENAMDSLKLED